jgi:hypothetical protein
VELKCFIKAEPTKVDKLERDMPRIVTGMPLHKTIKNNCVFAPFAEALVGGWKKSPVKYAFNPQRPGDIAHLASQFAGRRVVESDKSNWDYNYFEYLFQLVEAVVVDLAAQPEDMSDSDFDAYKEDIISCFKEVVDNATYRCTNGECFRPERSGCMKSGWLLTIAANSIGQLMIHVLALMRMGLTDEQIMSPDYAIVVGGDDVLQTFPPEFSTDAYRAELQSLGFNVTDFKVRDGFEGCEFFSNEFKHQDGVWQFFPTRFTKHVAHLRVTKISDLASSLSSHMLNHVWNTKKFNFFYTMFQAFRKKYPDEFPLVFLKSRTSLTYKVIGYESFTDHLNEFCSTTRAAGSERVTECGKFTVEYYHTVNKEVDMENFDDSCVATGVEYQDFDIPEDDSSDDEEAGE